MSFGAAEHRILDMFRTGTRFIFNETEHIVQFSGKPTCSKGEPKTDIYISAKSVNSTNEEFKISFKMLNADFLENKINAQRAEQLLGSNWSGLISQATSNIEQLFLSKPLIYKQKFGRTDAGAITLGWKFELLKVPSGQLSGIVNLTKEQTIDVYSGTNLTDDKKNSKVNNIIIPNSGVSNYILFENEQFSTPQQVINSLIPIADYVDLNPDIYFACKALNYRTFKYKYDGNRPLAVYVDWFTKENKLAHTICFDTPLEQGGDYVFAKLKSALNTIGADTTKDFNPSNIENRNILFS